MMKLNKKITGGIIKTTLLFAISALILGAESKVFAAPGDLDPAFGAGGKVQTAVGTEDRGNAMVLQPDGKIIVGGRSRPGAVRFDFALARFNADGSFDTTFGSGGKVIFSLNQPFGADDEILALALQADGKIIAVGSQMNNTALIATAVVRFNPNGSLDTSFGTGGIVMLDRSVEWAVIIQPDGKIVCGGGGGEAQLANFQITRLNPNGTRDTSFGTGGDVIIDFAGSGDGVYGLALQPDGKIIAAGRSSVLGGNDNFAVARLNPNGSLDQTFGTGGKTVADFANNADFGFAVALQTDGKIIVSGQARLGGNILDFGLVRFNADGSIDTGFGNGGRVTTNFRTGIDAAYAVKVQSNGKIVAAGVSGGTTSVFGVARYNANGSVDATFGSGGKTETFFNGIDQARALQIQPDGKIVTAGTARGGEVIGNFALARYIGDPVAPSGKAFDFDGDGKADISVFRPSDRVWYLLGSQSGFSVAEFGLSSDKIIPADYDGDGKTDVAVFRDGVWYILQSQTNQVRIDRFGLADDVPQTGDYDGDGRSDLAVFRPSDRVWYLLQSTNGFFATQFGLSDDKPVAADYDGDGKTDIAVFRALDSVWHLLRSRDGYTSRAYGISTDKPVPSDYDGDGKTDLAVYRDGVWWILNSGTNSDSTFQFGLSSDIPTPADYDGDGRTDIAVYRDGVWYLLRSQQGFTALQFGIMNDKPTPAAFAP